MVEQKEKIPVLKFGINLPAKLVLFEFDKGVEIAEHTATKKDGTTFQSKVQYYYTVMYQGKKHGLYANTYLNNAILALNPKGKTVKIGRTQGETDKYPSWLVEEVNLKQTIQPVVVAQQPTPVAVAQQPAEQNTDPF